MFVRHPPLGRGRHHRCDPTRPAASSRTWSRADRDIAPVTKRVKTAFHGDPDLERWLTDNGSIEGIVVCGITTNHCCETTARVAPTFGFQMSFAIDATHTFDLDDHEGGTIAADELARITAANLDPEFGLVVTATEAIDELR